MLKNLLEKYGEESIEGGQVRMDLTSPDGGQRISWHSWRQCDVLTQRGWLLWPSVGRRVSMITDTPIIPHQSTGTSISLGRYMYITINLFLQFTT